MSDMLKKHLKTLPNKGAVDKFAKEYFGIELDGRGRRSDMEKTLLEKAQDKTPLKQLPYEELLVEKEEVVTDAVPGTGAEVTKVDEQTDSDGSTSDGSDPDGGDVTVPDEETPEKPEQKSLQEILEESKLQLPYVELGMQNGPHKYTVVSYALSDQLDSCVRGDKTIYQVLEDIEPGQLKTLYSLLYYIEHFGQVMVRESRNSKFIIYKKDELI